jgi:hypothetical protein
MRNQLLNKRPNSDPIVLDDVDPTSDWVAETHPPEFDVDYDLEVELAGQVQMDADPLLGPCGPIPVSDMAGPSGTAGRHSCIPHSSPSQRQMMMSRARMPIPFLLLAVVMIDR